MEFDSPEAAKEFPGLYMAESGKVDDSLEYTDDGERKKSKKEKKKDKDKGYSALAAESSQDEDDPLDPKSPGKGMKIKAFSKLSGKKKEKDKKSDKSEKELSKKAEKEAKEKRKSEEKERKSVEKELNSTPGPSAPRPQIPFSGAHLMKANSLNYSSSLTPQSSIDLGLGTPVKRKILNESVKESTPSKPPKEKSAGFNVFLNAPAPLLSKLKDRDKDKDHHKDKSSKKEHKEKEKKHKDKDKEKEKGEGKSSKKDKEHKEKEKKDKDPTHASGMAKVKLKLMRSKNSLEDSSSGDLPHVTTRQFPEDPEALAKEIKKYEGLLEQAHTQLKSSKKISKKQEEQLWELQRTLTQLKRKLRSINALSCASAYHIHAHSSNAERNPAEPPVSPKPKKLPIFKKCDSIDGQLIAKKLSTNSQDLKPSASIDSGATPVTKEKEVVPVPTAPVESSLPQEIPKLPMPPSKNSHARADSVGAAITTSPPTTSPPQVQSVSVSVPVSEIPSNPPNGEVSTTTATPAALSPVNIGVNVHESSNNFASPRPSIDTIVQVHRSSMEGEMSDSDGDDTENNMEDLRDEGSSRIRSASHDSQEDSKESIEAVLDDANKMIGSMHEELMFESELDVVAGDARLRSIDRLNDSTNIAQEESDVELFTNDLELDPEATLMSNEEPCPDPFSMPVFDTAEYIAIENEALSLFNEQLKDDLQKEQVELEETLQRMPKEQNPEEESSENSQNENDLTDIITAWTKMKSENAMLWDNVNRLRQALAACRVDEFRLQTRLNYMEAKTSALSPVTTTTPLQTEG